MIEPSLVVEKLITETDTRPGVINPTKTINAMGINLIDNVNDCTPAAVFVPNRLNKLTLVPVINDSGKR